MVEAVAAYVGHHHRHGHTGGGAPYEPGRIAVRSTEYRTKVKGTPGQIRSVRENWLLKILDLFDLSGVMFVLHNLTSGTHSAGLGGSATATSGVCVLANELAGLLARTSSYPLPRRSSTTSG